MSKRSTVEIANVAPTLRSDLKFTLQRHGDQICYLIEDDKNSRFYRIGIPEYTFISLLDGTTSIREAMGHTAGVLGDEAFTEQDAASICKWLIDCQLAKTQASSEFDRLTEAASEADRARRLQKINPILLKLPLFSPNHLMGRLNKLFGWWFSLPAFVAWVLAILFAGHQVLTHWTQLAGESHTLFSTGNIAWLIASWILLKVVHEFSHGVSCKRFGGNVREAGVLFILFAPIPYVDVTSSWRFSSRWRRILVSAAGMYTELFCAALGVVVWANTSEGVLHQQAYNMALTASFMTLLFNANPLMRFDGYYILSDFLQIPNLYALGQQFTKYIGRRYLMGMSAQLPLWGRRRGIIIRAYGVCALVWRVFVCVSLTLAAFVLFEGAGIVLAAAAVLLWVGIPAFKLGRFLILGNEFEKPNFVRFVTVVLAIAGATISILLLPEPGGVRAPAVVRYEPLHIVRAPHAGFITQIKIRAGDLVTADEVLAEVANVDLSTELADMKVESLLIDQRKRTYQKDGDVAARQVEEEILDALNRRIAERSEQLSRSVIQAPATGVVVTRNLSELLGTYVEEGQELFSIGKESGKEIEVSIAQTDAVSFTQFAGEPVDIYFQTPGVPPQVGQLSSVDPRASRRLTNEALSAINGGPLTVLADDQSETDEETSRWQLLHPRFAGRVTLSADQSSLLRAGQLTTVRLRTARGSIGQLIYRTARAWLEKRLLQTS